MLGKSCITFFFFNFMFSYLTINIYELFIKLATLIRVQNLSELEPQHDSSLALAPIGGCPDTDDVQNG
jgi:hypothetical protein